MHALRTPDARFENLPDYDFEPRYAVVAAGDGDSLRMHYVDEGPVDGSPVLLLHGEPCWSFIYRKMIPVLVAAGHRCIAPDLIGFGRSDKPARRSDYSYQSHMNWLTELVCDHLDLGSATLFCQDWGGALGLRLVAENKARFSRIVAANTVLPTGNEPPNEAFDAWCAYAQKVEVFPVGSIVSNATVAGLPAEGIAAYDAPFPDETYKEGVRAFPPLVPVTTDDPARPANLAAWGVLERWEKPFLTAFSDLDPIQSGREKIFQERIPGARGHSHPTIRQAGHFLQEDKGQELAQVIATFIEATP